MKMRTAGVTTGERLEPVFQKIVVGRLADGRGDEHPVLIEGLPNNRIDSEFLNAAEVRLAARQQIRSRLSEEVLHALGDHEGSGQGECETHPARVPLPEFPPPDERLGCSPLRRGSGDEQQTHEEDDAGGCNERNDDKKPSWDQL